MKRLALALAISGLLAAPAAALAHPSENRNERSTFEGPHCHINLRSGTLVFPSHGAHLKQLALGPAGAVFTATECPD
ncbi:MAG: hypothetical protein M3N29_02585 [Chloroflexota bacterium]|nr:hypothetical protein [Chloroflexota bacterium]